MSAKNNRADDTLSELFEMLSHEYRRRLLIAVAQSNPLDQDEFTSEPIADGGDDEALAMLQQELYHTHLPKLTDAGFINWNDDTGIITKGPRFGEIKPLLKLMNAHQEELPDDWP